MSILFYKKTYKEKIIIKIWNSFFEKENLIENKSINNKNIDLILVATSGIYLFKIFQNKGNVIGNINDEIWKEEKNNGEVISFQNPINELEEIEKLINEKLNSSLKMNLIPIFNESKNIPECAFNIKKLKNFVDNKKHILSVEEVNKITEDIKSICD